MLFHTIGETSQVFGLCLENIGQPNMAQSLKTANIQI